MCKKYTDLFFDRFVSKIYFGKHDAIKAHLFTFCSCLSERVMKFYVIIWRN